MFPKRKKNADAKNISVAFIAFRELAFYLKGIQDKNNVAYFLTARGFGHFEITNFSRLRLST